MGAHSVSRAFVQQANGIPAGSKTLAATADFLRLQLPANTKQVRKIARQEHGM
jgi:hypothetical protein